MFTSNRNLLLTAILLLFFSFLNAQNIENSNGLTLSEVYNLAEKKYGTDQQMVNGIYFEDTYRGSKGHPYFSADSFQKGSLVFNNKKYEGVDLKYDIYKQQLLMRYTGNDFPLITILTDEFLSEFSIYELHFKKHISDENDVNIFQVLNEKGGIQCYYYWFKDRHEDIKDDDTKMYSFSSDRRKSYLLLDSTFSRYTNNRSFLKLFQENDRRPIKNYLRTNSMKVKKASDQNMKNLLIFCEEIINNRIEK